MCSSTGLPYNLGFLVNCDSKDSACEACIESLCTWLGQEETEEGE